MQMGNRSVFEMWSLKAFDELEKLAPEKVDRSCDEYHPGRLINPHSLLLEPSNSRWRKRRAAATKFLGLNFASKHTPLMNTCVDEVVEALPVGKEINLMSEIRKISMKII